MKFPEPRFACPYYKHDPAKYADGSKCRDSSWPRIPRLEEHLYRSHRQAKHCRRCWMTFHDDDELQAHQRRLPQCPLLDQRHVEGFDEEQEMQLRSRKGLSKMSDREKWRMIYCILFPHVAVNKIPDPHPNPSDSFEDISKLSQDPSPSTALTGTFDTIGACISRDDLVEYHPSLLMEDNPSEWYLPVPDSLLLKELREPPSHDDNLLQAALRNPISHDLNVGHLNDFDTLPCFQNTPEWYGESDTPMEHEFSTDGSVPDPSHGLMHRQDNEEEARMEPSDPYTKANIGANASVENELPDSRETKEDNVPYTDSGYESVQGLDHSQMQEEVHKQTDRTGYSNSFATSNTDDDDTKTSYSDFSTSMPQLAAHKCVVDVCNKINSRLDRSMNRRSFVFLSKILPHLIKAFAVKLGSEMPDQSNLRVMHFVHKQHQYIVSQLENGFHDDEYASVSPRKSMDAMPLDEIMSRWNESHDEEPVVVESSECFQGVSDEEDDGDMEPFDEERDISASSEYYQMIVKSAAYEWLISSLVKEASFHWDESQPCTMIDQIRQEILSQLPTGRISSRRPPYQHTACFKIPRSSLPFFSEGARASPNQHPATTIADWIVAISSSAKHVQMSRVSQYMDQTWPLGGGKVLSVLQNVITGTDQVTASGDTRVDSEIQIMLKGFYLEAIVTGTSYSIAEYGEQLAWLTAALQPAVSELPMYIRPFLRRIDGHTSPAGNRPSWSIELWRQGIDAADLTACSIQEWIGHSTNPVIVRGFPTLSRPENCPGIEVPPELLTSLLPSSLRESKETRLILGMTGKVLQLFEQTKGVAVWHVLGSHRETCVCRQRFFKNNDVKSLAHLDFVELLQNRHIITECSVAELYYRDTIPQIEPGIADTKVSQQEFGLSEAPQLTPSSENATDSSDSLDADMLSIPDSSEDGAGGPPHTDDATLVILEFVASRLVSEYIQCTEQRYPANEYFSNTKQCSPGGQQSTSTHGSSQSTLELATTKASSSNSIRKRPAEQDEGDGDENSQRKPTRKKQKTRDSSKGPRFFACPFWKHNPGKHSTCFGKKLDMISRVKQHLSRNHSPTFYCDRCLVVFPSRESKRTHLGEVCLFDDAAQLNGITSEQRTELSRKSDKSLSDPDQWFAVWDIVFPRHGRPLSPYLDFELSQDFNHFREFSERRGPALFIEEFHKEGLVVPGDHEREAMVRRVVARGMSLLSDQWLIDRTVTFQNSTSTESSSVAPSEQHHDERGHARVPMFGDRSSNADSGVEIRSQPSSGQAREDANLSHYPSIRPRPAPEARITLGLPATANQGVHTAGFFNNGSIPQQEFVGPPPVDIRNPDLLTQNPDESHIDPGFLSFDFEHYGDAELGEDFDLHGLFTNIGDGQPSNS